MSAKTPLAGPVPSSCGCRQSRVLRTQYTVTAGSAGGMTGKRPGGRPGVGHPVGYMVCRVSREALMKTFSASQNGV